MVGRHFFLRAANSRLTITSNSGGERPARSGHCLRKRSTCRRFRSMKSRTSALIGICALLAGVVPVLAGEVYVPFASNRSVDGTIYQTKVWVTNTGTAARRFDVRFISQNTDGTQGADTGNQLNVTGGGTLLLGSVAPSGALGMVEISGAPQLVVNARIDAIGPNGNILSSANVPVVGGGNVVKQNSTAHIQGLELTGRGTLSDF